MDKCIIAAVSMNNVIGKDNKMPWNISEDLKYFKKTTMGYPVIMGKNTYFSIGKPLPGRLNIVLTSNDSEIEGVTVAHSLEEAFKIAESENKGKCFVIGGASIYKQAISMVDYLYITDIYKEFEGDTFFPEINEEEWDLLGKSDKIRDEKSQLNVDFAIYSRKLL